MIPPSVAGGARKKAYVYQEANAQPGRLRRPATGGGMIIDPTVAHQPGQASKRRWLDGWMALLRRIGNVQAWIILSLFYVVILSPFGFVYRFAQDPLRLRRRGSTWQPFAQPYDTMAEGREQS